MNIRKYLTGLIMLCFSWVAVAEVNPAPTEVSPVSVEEPEVDVVDLMLSAGITIGGEDLATTTSGITVSTGGLIYLAAGAVWHASSNFDVQGSFGYHFDSVSATNGTAEFTRKFIELVPFYVAESGYRFGVGFTQILSPSFSSPFGGEPEFKDAAGMIFEIDWPLSRKSYIGVRYADITYDSSKGLIKMPNGDLKSSLDGNYIGLMIQANF